MNNISNIKIACENYLGCYCYSYFNSFYEAKKYFLQEQNNLDVVYIEYEEDGILKIDTEEIFF